MTATGGCVDLSTRSQSRANYGGLTGATGMEILTVPQVRAVAAAMAEHYRVAVIIAAGTGLRASEVAGLTWDRIDRSTDSGTSTHPSRSPPEPHSPHYKNAWATAPSRSHPTPTATSSPKKTTAPGPPSMPPSAATTAWPVSPQRPDLHKPNEVTGR
jgi:hypothetical protein